MPKIALLGALLPLLLCAPAGAAPNAYVVNEGSGSVSIIETQTDEVGATIKVGERPRGLAMSADGARLYVSHPDGRLIERDMYEKKESAAMTLGRPASSIDLSPDGRLLVGALQGGAEIVLIDPAMMRVLKTIPVRGGKAPERCFQPGRPLDLRHRAGKSRASRHRCQAGCRDELDPRRSAIARRRVPPGRLARVCRGRAGERGGRDRCRAPGGTARVKTASAPFGVAPHPDGKRVFVSAADAGKVQVLDISVNGCRRVRSLQRSVEHRANPADISCT
jgi:YVTN family beta-propeller protein